jgi:hypothetical protein
MAIESRGILKTFFETGDVPTAEQFGDVIDSYIHQTDDNVTIYLEKGTKDKRFGIGNKTPEAPLGITATSEQEDLAAFNKTNGKLASWFLNLNPLKSGKPGFNIDQVAEKLGRVSRFFIQEADGRVGLGTTTPDHKLHIEESNGGNGATGLRIRNTATVANNGYVLAHGQNSLDEQNGSFSIYENTVTDGNNRMTFRKGGNVGINSLIPDTKLHVERDIALAQTDLDLIPGTGIVTIGPMTANIVADYRGFQARTGSPLGDTYELEAAELNFQRLGGDVLFHGDDSIDEEFKVIITDDAMLGIGTLNPGESIDTIGAIKIGDANGTANGTIRYTGSDFEGRVGNAWVSFTGATPPPPPFSPWTQGPGNSIYYLPGAGSRIAVGANTAAATLDINDSESVTAGSKAAIIYNHAQTTGSLFTDFRIGLELRNNGSYSSATRNIGLYIPEVSGIVENEFNIAAVLNSNVVIGDVSTSEFLGAGADRVLSIQKGTPPAAPSSGLNAISVQVYAKDLAGTSIPTLHIMRANGEVVMLYKETGLTAADSSTITDSYDTVTMGVINNLRARVDELENRLMNFGLLGDPVPGP